MLLRKNVGSSLGFSVVTCYFAIFLLVLGGWIQHIVTCISEETYLLLIAGAIMAPIGIIHGWGVWLGAW